MVESLLSRSVMLLSVVTMAVVPHRSVRRQQCLLPNRRHPLLPQLPRPRRR